MMVSRDKNGDFMVNSFGLHGDFMEFDGISMDFMGLQRLNNHRL